MLVYKCSKITCRKAGNRGHKSIGLPVFLLPEINFGGILFLYGKTIRRYALY